MNASSLISSETPLLKEDTMAQKIFSCIPIVGFFFSNSAHDSFSVQLQNLCADKKIPEGNYEKAYQLLDVRRDYHFADACREVLTLAIVVAMIAASYFSLLTFALSAISCVFIGRSLVGAQQDAKNMGFFQKPSEDKNGSIEDVYRK